ncbi:MAG: hypothetical protein AAFY15_16875 [Cyanobacteria bacterium J06648_11]
MVASVCSQIKRTVSELARPSEQVDALSAMDAAEAAERLPNVLHFLACYFPLLLPPALSTFGFSNTPRRVATFFRPRSAPPPTPNR